MGKNKSERIKGHKIGKRRVCMKTCAHHIVFSKRKGIIRWHLFSIEAKEKKGGSYF